MSDVDEFGISEEEWSLLTNALAEPVEQLIVVESKDPGQLREIERRLPELAGTRPVLQQAVDFNAMREPENVWKTAQSMIQPANINAVELSRHSGMDRQNPDCRDATNLCHPWSLGSGNPCRNDGEHQNSTDLSPGIPLLVVVMDVWPASDDGDAVKQLAAFWRGMNQQRELWHSLPAQVLFLLSPAAYKHLSFNADHLKRWVSLKLRLWAGSTELEVLARPGSTGGTPWVFRDGGEKISIGPNAFTPTSEFLALQLEEAIKRGESKSEQVRRYYLPLITECLAMGDRREALFWREKIGDLDGLASEEREALKKLDEQLTEPTDTYRFDVYFSYNSRDRSSVRELSSALRNRGLNVWLDVEQLQPGRPWLTALEDALHHSASTAILIGKEGVGAWQNQEMSAMLREIARDNRPIIPVLLPDAPEIPTLPLLLSKYSWEDLRQGITESKIDLLVWGITGKKPSASA